MGSFADYLENKLLDHIFENTAYTPTATVELALWVGDPLDTGLGGAEAAYTNYARQTITFDAAASRLINQTSQVDFPQCGVTGQAGITHYAVCEASAGNILASGALSGTVNVVEGNTPSIAAGQVDISFSSGAMSDYLANLCLDFVFRNQTFTQKNLYIALTTATLAQTATGTTVAASEPVGNNYSRVDFGDFTAAAAGTLDNVTAINFPTPSGSWGNVKATAIVDAASNGNMLFFDNGIVDQDVNNGDTVTFPIGDFDVTLT